MLQAIRDNAQGWIAWVIVGLIIITFALFGIEQYAQGQKTIVIAEVNGEEINDRDFLIIYNRQKQRLQQQFGEMYDQVVKDEELREQVLDSVIQSEVMRQWAEANNMTISDAQLSATIQMAEVFKKDGQFDQETYQNILARNGLNVARFEYEQRQFLSEVQNTQLTQATLSASQFLKDQLVSLQFQKRDVAYLQVSKTPFIDEPAVTQSEIEAYFENEKAGFVVPEQVVVAYVELSQAEIANKVEIEAGALEAFYEDNLLQFIEPEQRQASHILIRATSEAEFAEAKIKAAQLLAELNSGTDFSALAQKESQDPGSAKSGGDLGMFQQGMMVPAFDDAVFSMQLGQISDLVKTDFGYHIIKLTDIKEKQQKGFDQVKLEVEQQYRAQEASRLYFDQLEQLNTIAYEQPDSLQGVVDTLGLEVKVSLPFSVEGGEGIASSPKIVTAAFSDDVKQGQNSSAIETSDMMSVVLRIRDVIPPRQQSLEEVSQSIRQTLAVEKATEAASVLAGQLIEKLNEGEKLVDLISERVELQEPGLLMRQNNQLLPMMTEVLFKMPKPEMGQMNYQKMQLITGDSVVMALKSVESGILPDKSDANLIAEIDKTAVDLIAGGENHARIQAMMDAAEIERMDAYLTIK